VVRRSDRIPAAQARLDGAPAREILCAAGPRSERKGSVMFLSPRRSRGVDLRRQSGGGIAGTRRRKGLFAAELCGVAA